MIRMIQRTKWFFNFNIPSHENTIQGSKFQETYFLPRNRFGIKVRNDKYEKKGASVRKIHEKCHLSSDYITDSRPDAVR